jgi:3-hydroxy-9,10-secoandrosta-1,3,5(10)-triene-9,17-dione monooxygenase reductase component
MRTRDHQQRYRSVIGEFATGVTIVTGLGPDGPVGMTANAICSLSLEPLLLLVCFDNSARTLPIVRRAGRFGVNVLSSDQHELSATFASKMGELEKFAGVPFDVEDGVPVIAGVLAWLACDLRSLYPGGDHTIGVGAVTAMHHDADGDPLVWYRGRYTTVAAARDARDLSPGEQGPGP